jgi:hypothetical protein
MSSFYLFLAYSAIFIVRAQCERRFPTDRFTSGGYLRPRQASSPSTDSASSSSPAPASTTATACSNNCTVCAADPYSYYWTAYTITETLVAATVIEIVNTLAGTTRTTTIFNDLPAGYTLPPTNAEGTHVQTVTYTRSGASLTTVL